MSCSMSLAKVALTLTGLVQVSQGANFTVAVAHIPSQANLVTVLADGGSITSPIGASAPPGTVFQLSLPETTGLRIRAIAIVTGNYFPQVLAATAATPAAGQAGILLDFAAAPLTMTVGEGVDDGEGTVTVPVTFIGAAAFFSAGDVLNLWLSPTLPLRNGAGTRLFAPLSKRPDNSLFQASFAVPRNLLSGAGYYQVGFYALDFGLNPGIPLLILPDISWINSEPKLTVTVASQRDLPSSSTPSAIRGAGASHRSAPTPSKLESAVPTEKPGLTGVPLGGRAPSPEDSVAPIFISDVVGLANELANTVMKGVGYALNRTATIDNAGLIDAAAGAPNGCVFVDGSSGPCATATGSTINFSDGEIPVGILNGVNQTFTILNVPYPSSSFHPYLNGVRLSPPGDFTMTGTTITFTGTVPQSGDTLVVDYRY
jgi:hypothetical protein